MSAGAVTEMISQFAGYFQIFEESARSRVVYNEMQARQFHTSYDPAAGRCVAPHPRVRQSHPTPHCGHAGSAPALAWGRTRAAPPHSADRSRGPGTVDPWPVARRRTDRHRPVSRRPRYGRHPWPRPRPRRSPVPVSTARSGKRSVARPRRCRRRSSPASDKHLARRLPRSGTACRPRIPRRPGEP